MTLTEYIWLYFAILQDILSFQESTTSTSTTTAGLDESTFIADKDPPVTDKEMEEVGGVEEAAAQGSIIYLALVEAGGLTVG